MKPTQNIPALTTDQMRKVDRLMIEKYHITLLQMMENAGRNLARLAQRLFLNESDLPVIILVGSGGNGGGALVCGRYLHNWGYRVMPVLTKPSRQLKGAARHQINTLRKMGVTIRVWPSDGIETQTGLIIDGLIGYSLTGPPAGVAKEMIEWANQSKLPVLSLDVPSGLDATRGIIHQPVIRAQATMTLALPKTGLMTEEGRQNCGDLYVADIGVPPRLYNEPELGLTIDTFFNSDEILRIE